MIDTFAVNFSRMPFKKPDRFIFDEGLSLHDIYSKLPIEKGMNIVASVNGEMIDESKYSEVFPKQSDTVVVANTPKGTGAGIIVASIIIGLIVGYVIYRITPKPNDSSSSESTSLASITGLQNEEKRYKPVSLILGKRTIAPAYAALPYTEILGEDEYYNVLLCAGYGPLKLENIKIGDTLLSDYPSDEYKIALLDHYENTSVTDLKKLWPEAVVQSGLEYTIGQSQWATYDWKVETLPGVGPEYTQASQDFFFPSGIYRINSDGKYRGRSVAIRHEIEVGSKYYIVSEVIDVNSSKYNHDQKEGQVYRDTTGRLWVNFRINSNDESYELLAQQINASDIYFSDSSSDKIVYIDSTATISSGIMYGIFNNEISTNVYYSVNRACSFIISGNTPRQRRRAIKYDIPTGYSGSIRTAKAYPVDSDDDAKKQDTVNWINMRSIKEESLESFSSSLYLNDNVIKPVYIALRIKATDNFTSMLDNINVVATQCIPSDWASEWSNWYSDGLALIPTENPADAYRWIMQGPANVSRLPNSRMALDNLLEWKTFCESQSPHENFRISHEVDSEYTLLKLLNVVATTGRAEFGFIDGKYGVVIKKNQDYCVQVFTPKNSWDFASARAYPEVVDGIKVEFDNENEDYQTDEVLYYDSRVDESNRTGKFTSVSYNNVPSAELALRHGRFYLLESALRREVYTLTTDAEGLVAKRGMKVHLQNDIIDVGLGSGRIRHISEDRTTFYIDEIIDLEAYIRATLDNNKILLDSLIKLDAEGIVEGYGGSYGIIFRNLTGDISEVVPCQYYGGGKWVINAGTLDTSIYIGDFVSYGELGNESLECVVDAIEYKDNYTCSLTLLNFAEEIYTYDGDDIPSYQSGLNKRPEYAVPAAPKLDNGFSYSPVTSEINIKVSYDFSYDFSIRSISLYMRSVTNEETFDEVFENDSKGWECVDVISDGDTDFIAPNIVRGNYYQFKSRITNSNSVVSPYSNILEGYISESYPPADVSGLTYEISYDRGIILSWSSVIDQDFKYYEVRYFDGISETVIGSTVSEEYVVGYAIGGEYRVYAKTTYDIYSENAASIDIILQTLGVVKDLVATVNYGTVSLDWDEPENTVYPISYYEIRKVLPNKTNTWEDATIIGRTSGSFTLVAEKTSGIYNYKVIAVDMAARQSEISNVRVTVDRAGDFVLLVDSALDISDTTDVSSENIAISDGIIYAPVFSSRTYQDRIDRISTEDTSGVIPPSEVTVQDKINAGWVRYIQPAPNADNNHSDPTLGTSPVYYERIIDMFDGYIDSDGSNTIGGTRVLVDITTQDIEEGVVMGVYLAASADLITWDEATEGTEDFFDDFRYVRVRLYFDTPLNNSLAQMMVTEMNIRLDVQKKTEEGVAYVNPEPITGETIVQLSNEFIDIESIVITVEGSNSANYYAVSIFADIPNPNEFSFKVYDNDGILISDTSILVSYIVRGV